MLRSTTTLAILLLLVASPTLAQTANEASEGLSVAWAKPTLHGVSIVGLPPTPGATLRPRLVLNLPAPKPVQLSHLDFGAYEPFVPSLAERINARPDMVSLSGSGASDPKLWLNGTEYRTTVGTSVTHKAGPTAIRARAGAVVPGMPNVGDRAHKVFLRASDLKVDVRYKF